MAQIIINFEQEDYDGNIVQLQTKVNSIEEKKAWIKQKKQSANYINKYFQIL